MRSLLLFSALLLGACTDSPKGKIQAMGIEYNNNTFVALGSSTIKKSGEVSRISSQETIKIIDLFLDSGMGPNVKHDEGFTIAHIVATKGHTAVLDHLVSAGVDLNLEDRSGSTPLDWAEEELLLDSGYGKMAELHKNMAKNRAAALAKNGAHNSDKFVAKKKIITCVKKNMNLADLISSCDKEKSSKSECQKSLTKLKEMRDSIKSGRLVASEDQDSCLSIVKDKIEFDLKSF